LERKGTRGGVVGPAGGHVAGGGSVAGARGEGPSGLASMDEPR